MAILSTPHVVVFPFMAQGHTIPLLDLSKALSRRGIRITIVSTESNAPFILSKVSSYPTISLSIIPFPRVACLPEGCESTADLPSKGLLFSFVEATENLEKPFEDVLREMCSSADDTPICVITDMFLYCTVEPCRLFGIPRLVSFGMGTLPMVISRSVYTHVPGVGDLSDSEAIHLPNVSVPFPFVKTDLPRPFRLGRDAVPRVISKLEEASTGSWGLIVNSFEELEHEYVAPLESLYNTRAWLVGPLLLHDHDHDGNGAGKEKQYVKWLDKHEEPGAVIYVSFGSQAHLSDEQMEEIAFGLEMAGQAFLWVVKSKTWIPPVGWEERAEEKGGLVVRDWVDQRGILAHPAVGGFMTHCGWNSVAEGLSMGVPLLAWPMEGEQTLNAKYVEMGLKAGVMVPQERDEEGKIKTVGRNIICDGVKELMTGERGTSAKNKAKEIGKMARQSVESDGSSCKRLDELIELLVLRQEESK